jgi:hypothetical protein
MKLIILARDDDSQHDAVFHIPQDTMVVPGVGDKIYWNELDWNELAEKCPGEKPKRWCGIVAERRFNFLEPIPIVTLVIKNFDQF